MYTKRSLVADPGFPTSRRGEAAFSQAGGRRRATRRGAVDLSTPPLALETRASRSQAKRVNRSLNRASALARRAVATDNGLIAGARRHRLLKSAIGPRSGDLDDTITRMETQIVELLHSARFEKSATALNQTLARATNDLESLDGQQQLHGARELSKLARSELSWMKLPVRDFFASPETRDRLGAVMESTEATMTRATLLIAIRNAYERYIVHPMWEPVTQPLEAQAWETWLTDLGGRFADDADLTVRAEAAYLLAISGDQRAWSIYLEVVPRRTALLSHLELALLRYPESIRAETRDALRGLASTTAAKHPRLGFTASSIATALGCPPMRL
jgi:hypothetical protein